MKLDIGGKDRKRPDWTILDIDPQYKPDIVDDARTLHKVLDNSCDELFASHILEHLFEWEVIPTLKIWLRKLKPNCFLTIYVPDIETAWKRYLNNSLDADFLLRIMVGVDPCASPYMIHKTMFWPSRLRKCLQEAGFRDIAPIARGDFAECGFKAFR